MRHLYFLILILLVSCSGKSENNGLGYFSNLQFSIDTVIIDPGEEIIFLEYELFGADKSLDDKYLFNFNIDDNTLEKINLDELKLEEKLPFEKEGPNGTGTNVGRIKVHNESQIMMNGMNASTLFSLEGEKLKKIFFENFSLGGHPLDGGEELRFSRELDTEANRLYGIVLHHKDKSFALGILHLDKYEISKLEMKAFERMPNYTFINNLPGGSKWIRSPEMEIEKFGAKVILSNQITSAMMWYDTGMDSLFMKSYSSQLTANDKVKEYNLEHETEESFDAEYRRFHQEINFMPPFWDEKNQVFYRFSYQEIPSESRNDEDVKSKILLTVFDKDLSQLGESLVPRLNKKPAKHFAKDGKIWIYENINDEMGFVVLTISG